MCVHVAQLRLAQCISRVALLEYQKCLPFVELFAAEEGRLGVVVTFMAILELIKESLVELVQNAPFAAIHVRARIEQDVEA